MAVCRSAKRASIASWTARAACHTAGSMVLVMNIFQSQKGISGKTTTSVGLVWRKRTKSVHAASFRGGFVGKLAHRNLHPLFL